jgi:hypothetical protein
MRSVLTCITVALMADAAAAVPCDAPISRQDVRQISRVIRSVTSKPILVIMAVDADKRVPGAVITGRSFQLDLKTGKRTYRYTRTDLVSVYMTYKERAHVDVYEVKKVAGRWKI